MKWQGYSETNTLLTQYATFVRKNRIPFDWQRSFYDHVVRDSNELARISRHIRNNPETGAGKKLRETVEIFQALRYLIYRDWRFVFNKIIDDADILSHVHNAGNIYVTLAQYNVRFVGGVTID